MENIVLVTFGIGKVVIVETTNKALSSMRRIWLACWSLKVMWRLWKINC